MKNCAFTAIAVVCILLEMSSISNAQNTHVSDAALAVNQAVSSRQSPAQTAPSSAVEDLNKSQLVLFFKEENLTTLLVSGEFKNLHQTGFSGGANVQDFRRQIEFQIWGLAGVPAVHGLNPEEINKLLPKYAQLFFDLKNSPPAFVYGKIGFILKDNVKSRATWTPGDSMKLERQFGYSPTEYVQEGLINTFNSKSPVQEIVTPNYYYYEAQVWGELNLSDVKEILIPEDTIPEIFEKLKSLKVPIKVYSTINRTVRSHWGEDKDLFFKELYAPGKSGRMFQMCESIF